MKITTCEFHPTLKIKLSSDEIMKMIASWVLNSKSEVNYSSLLLFNTFKTETLFSAILRYTGCFDTIHDL